MHAFILRDPHPPHALASEHRPAIGSDKLPSQRRDVARTTSVGSPAFPSSSFCADGGTRGESTTSRTQPVPFGPATGNDRLRATPHRLEDAGPAKSNFPAAACPASQDSAGIVEGVDRCLLSRSFCSRRERRRPRLGGDFGRAGAQRRRSGELARRWSRRVGEHLLPRLAAKQDLVRKFFTGRVGKGRDRQLTTLAFRNIFDETLARPGRQMGKVQRAYRNPIRRIRFRYACVQPLHLIWPAIPFL